MPGDEAAAHDHHVGQAQEQAELAQGVGDIDVGLRRRAARRAAPGDVAAVAQVGGDLRAAFGMARRDDQQARSARRSAARRSATPRPDGCWRRGRPAAADGGAQALPARPVAGQGLADELQVQRGRRAARRALSAVGRWRRPAAGPGRRRRAARARRAGQRGPAVGGLLGDARADTGPAARRAPGRPRIRFGHSSLSTNTARSGRQWSRKRAHGAGRVDRARTGG